MTWTVFINYKVTKVCIPKTGSVYQVAIKEQLISEIPDFEGHKIFNDYLQNTLPPQWPIPPVLM